MADEQYQPTRTFSFLVSKLTAINLGKSGFEISRQDFATGVCMKIPNVSDSESLMSELSQEEKINSKSLEVKFVAQIFDASLRWTDPGCAL